MMRRSVTGLLLMLSVLTTAPAWGFVLWDDFSGLLLDPRPILGVAVDSVRVDLP